MTPHGYNGHMCGSNVNLSRSLWEWENEMMMVNSEENDSLRNEMKMRDANKDAAADAVDVRWWWCCCWWWYCWENRLNFLTFFLMCMYNMCLVYIVYTNHTRLAIYYFWQSQLLWYGNKSPICSMYRCMYKHFLLVIV